MGLRLVLPALPVAFLVPAGECLWFLPWDAYEALTWLFWPAVGIVLLLMPRPWIWLLVCVYAAGIGFLPWG